MANTTRILAVFTLLCFAAAFLLPAMPQPLAYHDFADRRAGLGLENLLDVGSNLAFVLVALGGLAVALRARIRFEQERERIPYALFFAGMLLTGFGSAYYHLAPDNERLLWDRLPMTIAFMSLISAQISDRIGARAGLASLGPLLLLGLASVVYWHVTERAGAGNVMPYGVLQAYAVVMPALIAWRWPSRYTRGRDIGWVLAGYAAAKLLEQLDHEILAQGHVVSGHTLKHLVAAAAGFAICRMLMLRSVKSPAARLTTLAAA